MSKHTTSSNFNDASPVTKFLFKVLLLGMLLFGLFLAGQETYRIAAWPKMKARLHHWRAMDVQRRVETKAHQDGMRFSKICAWNTSKLAFDGSGTVSRGIHGNYSVCRFTYGKIYNCDLSASYNIGARFFLREYMKLYPNIDLPKTPWCIYNHLINIHHLQVAFAT